MKITIKGSPKELAELAKVLNGGEIAAEKKADIPPLLTELAKKNIIQQPEDNIKELAENIQSVLEKMNENAKQRKGSAPQAEAAEKEVPFWVRPLGNRGYRDVVSQNSHAGKENAPQTETTEQKKNQDVIKKQED